MVWYSKCRHRAPTKPKKQYKLPDALIICTLKAKIHTLKYSTGMWRQKIDTKEIESNLSQRLSAQVQRSAIPLSPGLPQAVERVDPGTGAEQTPPKKNRWESDQS